MAELSRAVIRLAGLRIIKSIWGSTQAVKDKKNFYREPRERREQDQDKIFLMFLFSASAIPSGLGGQAKVANKTKAKIFWPFFFPVVSVVRG